MSFRKKYRPVSRKIYEGIFHEMNIAIKSPKAYTCATCDRPSSLIKNATNEEIKKQYETKLKQHQQEAESAYEYIFPNGNYVHF